MGVDFRLGKVSVIRAYAAFLLGLLSNGRARIVVELQMRRPSPADAVFIGATFRIWNLATEP